jgi:hypothetical protein
MGGQAASLGHFLSFARAVAGSGPDHLAEREGFELLLISGGTENCFSPRERQDYMAGQRLLTVKEVEGLLRIDRKIIYAYVQEGLIFPSDLTIDFEHNDYIQALETGLSGAGLIFSAILLFRSQCVW